MPESKSFYVAHGRYYANVTIAPKTRRGIALSTCTTDAEAEARGVELRNAVAALRTAGQKTGAVLLVAQQLAGSKGHRLEGVREFVVRVCNGTEQLATPESTAMPSETTFGSIAEAWTSGGLHKLYPEHVAKIDHEGNLGRYKKWLKKLLGPVPMSAITLEHAEEALRNPALPKGSRRHVAQIVARVCSLAVYPCRVIKASPIPLKWLPRKLPKKAGAWFFPEEEAAILADRRTALVLRVLVGVLAREGMRSGEAASLERSDVDLERGIINLDVNKSKDPRAWAMADDTKRGLELWLKIAPASRWLFPLPGDPTKPINVEHLADLLRVMLRNAGVTRPALFEQSESRRRARAHDIRATFVTLSLAAGKSETWVADRTGHRSSTMINTYRRVARTAAEVGVGTLAPLDQAIPELSAGVCGPEDEEGGSARKSLVRRTGVEPVRLAALEPEAGRRRDGNTRRPKRPRRTHRPRATSGKSADAADGPQTRLRARRSTRLGRAVEAAIEAALSGDVGAIGRTMRRFEREAGR